jgi:hypothetical protein
VTANGRALRCDARTNFGVVTGFTFTTHRVSTGAWFFASFPWSRAVDVVRAWQAWAPQAADELFSICALETGSSGPECTVFGQWTGSEAGLRQSLRGLTREVTPSSLGIGTSSYIDLMLRWAGCMGESPAASTYVLKPLSTAGVRVLTSAVQARQGDGGAGSGALLLDSYGGVINRVSPSATAFVHRDALFSIQFAAYWGGASEAAEGVAWVRGTRRRVLPHASPYAYQNYIDPGLGSFATAWYGGNLPRLRQVKATYDPDRVFRFRQGITA